MRSAARRIEHWPPPDRPAPVPPNLHVMERRDPGIRQLAVHVRHAQCAAADHARQQQRSQHLEAGEPARRDVEGLPAALASPAAREAAAAAAAAAQAPPGVQRVASGGECVASEVSGVVERQRTLSTVAS